MVGAGRERLVQVEDVELLVAHRPDDPELRRGVGRDRRDRAVGGGRDAVAERRDPAVGRRAVAGREDPRVVAAGAQRAGQAEHLALHAPGHGEAVRAHQPDPHRRKLLLAISQPGRSASVGVGYPPSLAGGWCALPADTTAPKWSNFEAAVSDKARSRPTRSMRDAYDALCHCRSSCSGCSTRSGSTRPTA